MSLIKYDIVWAGIDAGREGLWRDPLWRGVLKIVGNHPGQSVYDASSPIYGDLMAQFPREKWKSTEASGKFRPLFRDYPNAWTRTGVLNLEGKEFNLTPLGLSVVKGETSKEKVILDLLRRHNEKSDYSPSGIEYPFSIIASAFLEYGQGLTPSEVFWGIMKNYRPSDDIKAVISKTVPRITELPESTPLRRLKNMLWLMRHIDAVQSVRRGKTIYWEPSNEATLQNLCRTPI
ncbi:MAG: hypothetical protein M0Q93_04630 [Terrimicrobiaceae bacterium]|nr:hypothetical protein [Terrimicrobiaceae bacterium]